MSNYEVHVPLREYLEEKFNGLPTKDEVAAIALKVVVIETQIAAIQNAGPKAATWGAAGTFVGGLVVGILSFLGIKPPHQ